MARTFSITLLRVLLASAAFAMALSAAFVFEAARAAAAAFREVDAALQGETPEMRVAALLQAAEGVETSWAKPERWHAGASEAVSWAYAALAPGDQSGVFTARSITSAQRTLSRAPVQAPAWTRLAVFGERGQPNTVCAPQACLERSWRAVPLAPLATACARLQLGHELGLIGSSDDPRVALMAQVPMGRETLSRCASFLSEAEMFRLMLRQEAAYAERERQARETGRSPFTRPYN